MALTTREFRLRTVKPRDNKVSDRISVRSLTVASDAPFGSYEYELAVERAARELAAAQQKQLEEERG